VGAEPILAGPEGPGIDELMAALKQSVEEAKRRRGASEKKPRRAG
jgi:hypothetical protein